MRWHRVDPVQHVGALIAIGAGAVARLAATMAAKPLPLQSLPVAHGEGWAAIFAAPLADPVDAEAGMVLPRLADTQPLYEVITGLWLPIGVAPAVPDHLRDRLMRAMCRQGEVDAPAIIVPRFAGAAETGAADAYVIGTPVAFHRSALAVAPAEL